MMFTIFWASISAVGLGLIFGIISGVQFDWIDIKEKLLMESSRVVNLRLFWG